MKFFPEATYVLYEPQPVHNDALDAFAESCQGPVLLIKKAVGGSEGHTFFDVSDAFGGELRKNSTGASTISVELTTIDASTAQARSRGALSPQIRYAWLRKEHSRGSSSHSRSSRNTNH